VWRNVAAENPAMTELKIKTAEGLAAYVRERNLD
jgi:hypothetical protein